MLVDVAYRPLAIFGSSTLYKSSFMAQVIILRQLGSPSSDLRPVSHGVSTCGVVWRQCTNLQACANTGASSASAATQRG